MRTPEEIKRQIQGILNQKEHLPEYSKVGTPNWQMFDAQIDILKGSSIEEYELDEWDDEEGDEGEIYRAAEEAVNWLEGHSNDDLFDKEYEPKIKIPSMISVIATNDNITIAFKGERLIVNRLKNASSFEKVLEKVKNGEEQWLIDNFEQIKSDLELKTNGHFTITNGVAVLKGSTIPVPDAIMKKLVELETESEPILPLLKFWRKLSQNPSAESRKDLYGFMVANNIPITEEGDLVTEKGVKQNPKGFPGDLLDIHSGVIDNSIGSLVEMPREKVNPDRNQTCSTGLHVAAPDYVRKHWTSDVIVECIVNPKDVVSVPTDYSNTKMRVCAYRVAGYSRKNSRAADKVVKLSDFFTTPLPEQEQTMTAKVDMTVDKETVAAPKLPKGTTVTKVAIVAEKDELDYATLSAKAIVDHVFAVTGEKITFSLKSKKSIVKKAQELLEIHKIKNS